MFAVLAAMAAALAGCGGSESRPAARPIQFKATLARTSLGELVPLSKGDTTEWLVSLGTTTRIVVVPDWTPSTGVRDQPPHPNSDLRGEAEIVASEPEGVLEPVSTFEFKPAKTGRVRLRLEIFLATDPTIRGSDDTTLEVVAGTPPAVPAVKLYKENGSEELAKEGGEYVAVKGTKVAAKTENADRLEIIQPDNVIVTLAAAGEVTFTAALKGKYSITPLKGTERGATVILNVRDP
ncbi:MAG: hypothetical protein AAB360_02505 [Patescibacteria group bacterium]